MNATYLSSYAQSPFEPCIPTKVLDRPEWLHEIKHDGYRLIVQRDGQRAAGHPQRPRLDRAVSVHR
jgi:hypothetical protein